MSDIDISPEFMPISRVIAWRSSDSNFIAGDETGRTLEFESPWATQEMADDVLAAVKGFVYRPYEATDAILDLKAEIGDGITVGGIYSILATKDINYDALTLANISAPQDEELDHEYPYETKTQKKTDRKIKGAYSLITKTDEEIRLFVADEIKGLEASFSVTAGEIRSYVDDKIEGVSSEISQTASSLTARIESVEGEITYLSLDIDGIKASVSGLEGDYSSLVIQIGSIESVVSDVEGNLSTVRQTVGGLEITTKDLEDSVGGLGDGTTRISGYCIQTGKISAEYLEVENIVSSRIGSGMVELLDSRERTVGTMSISSSSSATSGQGFNVSAPAIGLNAEEGDVFLNSRGNATYLHVNEDDVRCKGNFSPSGSWNLGSSSSKWANVYANNGTIQTSDRTQKTDIVYGLDEYSVLFDALKPCHYRMADGGKRIHLGLISQDVEESMKAAGISDMNFAGFIKTENGDGTVDYALRYGEFIPMLIDQAQKSKKRIEVLEERVAKLEEA